MNGFRSILTGFLLFFTIFFILRRLLALAAVVYDAHIRCQLRQRELLTPGQRDRRYMPLSVLVMAGSDPQALLATLESLQKQTYPLYEILILEDCMEDAAVQSLTAQWKLLPLPQPVRRQLKCTPETAIYESCSGKIPLRLVRKPKTCLGDAWNLGVNIARYPYFACIPAGMQLSSDGLDKLMRPFFQYSDTLAVGGSPQVAEAARRSSLSILENLEFDRSAPALQKLLRRQTLLLCSGPAAYRKDAVIAAGGFPARDLGTEAALSLSLQRYCHKKNAPCRIVYAPEAKGYLPPSTSFAHIYAQHRLWQQGMRYAMYGSRELLILPRFGTAGLQYFLFLLFSLWAPLLSMLGGLTIALCLGLGVVDVGLLAQILLLSFLFKLLLSISVFHTRTEGFSLPAKQLPAFVLLWLLESTLYRLCITIARIQGLFSRKT